MISGEFVCTQCALYVDLFLSQCLRCFLALQLFLKRNTSESVKGIYLYNRS